MVHPNPNNTWLGSFIKRTWYHHCSCKYLLLFDDINRRSIRHAGKPGMPRNSILRILALHLSANTCYPAQFCKSLTFFPARFSLLMKMCASYVQICSGMLQPTNIGAEIIKRIRPIDYERAPKFLSNNFT